uniref:ZP domain-containing protein n=1 Tax=Steinernema glaseri TaxID=37863 RepID=A0A1I7Z1Y1_9BILA
MHSFANGESFKLNVEIIRGPGEINKSAENPHVEVRHITSQVGLSVLERLSYIRHTSTFLSHDRASALIHIYLQAPMLSRVLTTAVFLILSSSSATTLSFVECPKSTIAPKVVSVPFTGSVGVRSYDWPNSMVAHYEESRYGKCAFRVEVSLCAANTHGLG